MEEQLEYSRLSLSRSPRGSEILRDIHTLTYQICRIEEKINRTTTFHKCICNLTPEVRDILKILWKRGAVFCYLLLDFHGKTGTRFSHRDNRLFEINEVEITRVNCTLIYNHSHKALTALVGRLSLSVSWGNGPERGLKTITFSGERMCIILVNRLED